VIDPAMRIEELEAEVECLQDQLAKAMAENDSKDRLIQSLQAQLDKEDENLRRQDNLQSQLNEYWISKCHKGPSCAPFSKKQQDEQTWVGDDTLTTMSVQSIDSIETEEVVNVVSEIQRWLFLEGGNLRDVEGLITQYCLFCRSVGMPLDRLFIAGMMLHPNVSAYVWKWEDGCNFNEHEVPHSAFEKPNYNPNEPFAVLMEGRAMEYRMSPLSGDEIPPGCAWFTKNNYQDYFALPIYHQGQFKGAMAWCTKDLEGFSKENIEVFHQSLAALSTVLRLHTNDLVMKTLVGRLEQDVQHQTEELQKANSRLEEANKQVLSQSRAQLQHFAMMSHEIRTPLNGIVGISHLLKEEPGVPEDVRDSIQMIATSGDLLLAVVNDVLDYSKLASGNVDISLEPTSIRQCLQPLLHNLGVKAAEQGQLQLRTRIAPEVTEGPIETDGRRLQQILYNLLGNAVKFGKNGGHIDFDVSVEGSSATTTESKRTEDYGHTEDTRSEDERSLASVLPTLCFRVKDYGKGIASDELAKIFEPFQQASTNSPTDGGTGLGLAITSRLVGALGGTISVESEFGKYCEFTVRMPLKECQEPLPTIQASPVISKRNSSFGSQEKDVTFHVEPTVALADLRVLIAEDNKVNQKVLSRTLSRIGVEDWDIVDNGKLAVTASEKKDYDVIFMDWQMPVMDGLEATRQIRERGNGEVDASVHQPRIIFLTAHAFPDYEEQAASVRADGFISKPFKKQTIESVLERFGFLEHCLEPSFITERSPRSAQQV